MSMHSVVRASAVTRWSVGLWTPSIACFVAILAMSVLYPFSDGSAYQAGEQPANTVTNAQLVPSRGHIGPVTGVTFNREATLAVTSSRDRSIILWDVATGRVLRRLQAHSAVTGVTITSDDHYVVAGDGATVVEVHQVVRDLQGQVLLDEVIRHAFHVKDGQVVRFDIVGPSALKSMSH